MVLPLISHHQVHHRYIVYKGGIHKEVAYQFNDVVRRMIPDPRPAIPRRPTWTKTYAHHCF